MSIQLASDIHLEQNPGLTFAQLITPSADIMVLAGDIGAPKCPSYREFLAECSRQFKHVILIAGNHEYRRCIPDTMAQTDANIKHLCTQWGNVHYLANGETCEIGEYNFIGATLWSRVAVAQFPSASLAELNARWAPLKVDATRPFTIEESVTLFQEHLQKIEVAINSGISKKLKNIIVTHHAPIMNGPFKTPDPIRDSLYATDLGGSFDGRYIRLWLFGHTHWNYTTSINGTHVLSNQYGAKGIKGWNGAFSFKLAD